MKKELLLICFLLAIVFTACQTTNPTNEGYKFSVNLNWADKNDEGVETKDIYFWAFNAIGELVKEHYYATRQGASLDLLLVDAGSHNIITVTNFGPPFSIDKITTHDNLILKLDKASASPSHTYYGITNVSVLAGKIKSTTISLSRAMSELNIEIEGAPQGATLEAFVTNAADGVHPQLKDDEGNFGRAASGNKNIVALPKTTALNGTISTETMRLMPTVVETTKANNTNSYMRFLFTFANGTTRECDAEAPRMRASGKYSLKIKYSQLKPYMIISPIKINDWEEGWIVSGEILNPVIK